MFVSFRNDVPLQFGQAEPAGMRSFGSRSNQTSAPCSRMSATTWSRISFEYTTVSQSLQ